MSDALRYINDEFEAMSLKLCRKWLSRDGWMKG